MNIIYILPVYWPAIGGCELHTRELVKLIANHHHVKVITQVDSQQQKLRARKGRSANNWFVTTIWAPRRERIYVDNNAIIHRLGLHLLERLIAYTAVRLHPNAEDLTMKILTTIFMRKVFPLTEEANLIHCIHGGVSYLGLTAFQIARKRGIPFVYTPVAHLFTKDFFQKGHSRQSRSVPSFPNPSFEPRQWRDRFWFELCHRSDALITMTHYEKDFFQHKGIKSDKIVPVGVGPILAAKGNGKTFRQKYRLGRDNKIVLFLGRKHESKGILEVITAAPSVWQKHPEVYFFFIGPLEGQSKALFDRYRDSRIIEVGFVNEQEKADVLEACDIFCLPSTEESLGGVYLEAWMCEKPIIGANIPPLQELTGNGQGGFLVSPDPDAIAKKIILLLENDDLRIRMGQWGKRRVTTHYNWDCIGKKMQDVYSMLVRSNQSVRSNN